MTTEAKNRDGSLKTLPGFDSWLDDNLVEIEMVQSILADRLSDNPSILAEQLSKAEAWHARATSLLADSNAYLDLAERAALADRNDHDTDLDRRTRQRAAVSQERRLRDILDGLCKSIETRLILGMSMLKRNAGERTDWAA